ncbi:MAG: sigma-54 dependent transcriptional regulator [Spirochaetota bacterium]|nr:sigma-54 dependent transcriptional regulator [Spirochaetota bacterium]
MFVAKIIVIDDEVHICESCQEILTDDGHCVKTFTDPINALQHINKEHCDIVLLDLKLPHMDGLEVLKQLKEKYPELIVIVITGFATIDTAVQSMKLGAYDYVRKPFTPDELSEVVKRAVENIKILLEVKYLNEELQKSYELDTIVGESEAIKRVFALVEKVAPTDTDVLIFGESGTGKELIARAIYKRSIRSDKKFVVIDCASLAQSLVESELFGYVKGAFTGAATSREGLFEIADGGTIFLDEITNISLEVQAKLLRILQEREFKRVGDTKSKKLNIRFISATNRDLEELIKEGKFREDLYYRLDVFAILIPSLRERKGDIPLLCDYFIKKFSHRMHKDIKGINDAALEILINYSWPGNIRELKNIIERLVILSGTQIINEHDVTSIMGEKTVNNISNVYKIGDVGLTMPTTYKELKKLKNKIQGEIIDNVEKKFLLNALHKTGWNITKAAEITGILRPNLYTLLKKHNIVKE